LFRLLQRGIRENVFAMALPRLCLWLCSPALLRALCGYWCDKNSGNLLFFKKVAYRTEGSFYHTFKGFDFPFGLLRQGTPLKMFSLQRFAPFAGHTRLWCDRKAAYWHFHNREEDRLHFLLYNHTTAKQKILFPPFRK